MRGLRELKKLLLLLVSLAFLQASGREYLNDEQNKILGLEQDIDAINSTSLKYNWIEPVVASYTYSKNDQMGEFTSSKYYKVSLNQPIFKSGGIYFAIKYADANEEFKSIATSMKHQGLIKRLYELVLNLQKADFQLSQVKLKIQNSDIDISRKKQRFLSGDDDISFLNRAMLEKNRLKVSKLTIKSNRLKLINSYKNLSNIAYSKIKLPELKLIDKNEFIRKNLSLKLQKSNVKQINSLKNMTISNYLPTFSLFGDYNYKEDEAPLFRSAKSEYRSYGIRVSMPLLAINRSRDIEVKKLEVLKEKLALKQKQKDIVSEYQNILLDNEMLVEKLSTLSLSIELYKSLVKSTRDGVKAGDKTTLDLKTAKNSMKSLELDYFITQVDIKLNILKLFEKMSDEI